MEGGEENPIHKYQDSKVEEINDEPIQEAQQDPTFHKFMKKDLESNKEK